MVATSTNGVVAIPKWFLAVASFILVAAVPWAMKQSVDIASTKVEVRGISHRVERIETQIDNLYKLQTGIAE